MHLISEISCALESRCVWIKAGLFVQNDIPQFGIGHVMVGLGVFVAVLERVDFAMGVLEEVILN